jgi:hypothetical protein
MAVLDAVDIDHCLAIADNLARHFASTPEKDLMLALPDLQAGVAADVVDLLGAEAAAIFSQGFVATILRRRREIEGGGSAPALH